MVQKSALALSFHSNIFLLFLSLKAIFYAQNPQPVVNLKQFQTYFNFPQTQESATVSHTTTVSLIQLREHSPKKIPFILSQTTLLFPFPLETRKKTTAQFVVSPHLTPLVFRRPPPSSFLFPPPPKKRGKGGGKQEQNLVSSHNENVKSRKLI